MAELVRRLRYVSVVLLSIWLVLLYIRRCSDAAWLDGEGYQTLFSCLDWIVLGFTAIILAWDWSMTWRETPRLFWRKASRVTAKWALFFTTITIICVIMSFIRPDEMPPEDIFTEGAILYVPAIVLTVLWLVARYKYNNWKR